MIFNIDEASVPKPLMPKVNKTEQTWIQIGVEFSKAKKKGFNSKTFAEERQLNYASFTKAMSRYSDKIKLAVKAEELSGKPVSKLTRQERQIIMINSFRSSIREKIRNEGAAVNNKSSKWFADTLRQNIRGHSVSRPQPGKVYAYMYDAKHKDTLPYWDKYPLIVYLGMANKGSSTLMYGLNLHYIPPKARQQFLEELLKQYSNTPVISNKTKLNIDWSKVKGFKGSDKMIKAYIPGNIKGKIIEIKPSDWANVVLLPLQQFVSQGKRFSAQKVWSK